MASDEIAVDVHGLRAGDLPLATLRTLADPSFWPRAFGTSVRVGLLYVVWLALLTFVWTAYLGSQHVMPQVDAFVGWLAPRLPTVRFTADGPKTDATEPFVLEHPDFGTVLVVDTGRQAPDLSQPAIVSVLKEQVVLRPNRPEGRAEYRGFDVVARTPEQRASWSTVVVDGAWVTSLYDTLRPLWLAVPAAGSAFWLAWKIGAAVSYAVAAAIIAALLRVRVAWSGLIAASCFALTAVAIAEWAALAGWSNPLVEPGPSIAVTVAYLLAGVLLARGARPA